MVLSQQNQLKLYLPDCLVEDGLDMPSSIYDSIKHVSVMSFCMTTSSTHYQGAVLLTNDCLFTFLSANNRHKTVIYMSRNKQNICGNVLANLGSLVMCTVYTNKFTFGRLKLRLGL